MCRRHEHWLEVRDWVASVKSVIRLPNMLWNGRSRYSVSYPKKPPLRRLMLRSEGYTRMILGWNYSKMNNKNTSRGIFLSPLESSINFTALIHFHRAGPLIFILMCSAGCRNFVLLFRRSTVSPSTSEINWEGNEKRSKLMNLTNSSAFFYAIALLRSFPFPLHQCAENLPPSTPAQIMFCWFRGLFESESKK